jgi:hypothetical protein
VTGDVALDVFFGDHLVVLSDRDDDRALELTDERVGRVDTRVEDAHAHALAGRAAERPVLRDALGPVGRKRDPVDGILREAPGRERGFTRVPAMARHVLHGVGQYGARPVQSDPAQLSLRRSRISSRMRRSGS